MTKFDLLVDLIMSCGAEKLKKFLERTGKNAIYLSKIAVVEFIEAVDLWAEESAETSPSGLLLQLNGRLMY